MKEYCFELVAYPVGSADKPTAGDDPAGHGGRGGRPSTGRGRGPPRVNAAHTSSSDSNLPSP